MSTFAAPRSAWMLRALLSARFHLAWSPSLTWITTLLRCAAGCACAFSPPLAKSRIAAIVASPLHKIFPIMKASVAVPASRDAGRCAGLCAFRVKSRLASAPGPLVGRSRSLPTPRSSDVKQHAHIPLSAILLIVVASACFSAVDVTVKHLSQRYPVPLLVWARWGAQALVLLALMGPRMRLDLVRTTRLPLHLARGVVLIASSLCFFSALSFLPLAEATALNYTAP